MYGRTRASGALCQPQKCARVALSAASLWNDCIGAYASGRAVWDQVSGDSCASPPLLERDPMTDLVQVAGGGDAGGQGAGGGPSAEAATTRIPDADPSGMAGPHVDAQGPATDAAERGDMPDAADAEAPAQVMSPATRPGDAASRPAASSRQAGCAARSGTPPARDLLAFLLLWFARRRRFSKPDSGRA